MIPMAEDPAHPTADAAEPPATDSPPDGAPGAGRLLRPDGTRGDPAAGVRIAPHDFRNPAFLTEAELRRLRLLHEDFVRSLATRLSLHLRMECALKLAGLTTAAFADFTESLPGPTHIGLFKVEPLVGIGVVDLNPRLALAIADRLLGGRGQAVKAARHLTEIETALIEDVLVLLLEEWCALWKTGEELRPQIVGHESNGRFLQTSSRDTVVLVLTLEAAFGDCAEPVRLGVPYYLIEPVVKKLQARRQKEAAAAPAAAKRTGWHPAYDHVAMPVRAEWQVFDLSLREIAGLRVGDVIEMPASTFNDTRVLLNGTPKFAGTVGLDTDRVAVQLTRKLPGEDALPANTDGNKHP